MCECSNNAHRLVVQTVAGEVVQVEQVRVEPVWNECDDVGGDRVGVALAVAERLEGYCSVWSRSFFYCDRPVSKIRPRNVEDVTCDQGDGVLMGRGGVDIRDGDSSVWG